MKTNLKKHWKAVLAFAVGGTMCLGLGIFAICNTSPAQLVENQTDGVLQLVPESAGSTTQGVFLTVSEWNELGTYGSVNSTISHYKTAGEDANDPAGQAIWKEIQDSGEMYGTVTLYTVTLQLSDTNDNYYTAPIQVVAGSPISANANVLTIGGTNFTAPSKNGYVCMWKLDNATLPESITADCTITASYEL